MASPGAVVIYIPGCLLPGFRPPVLIVYRVGFAESCSTLIGQPFYKARSILGRVASVAGASAAATLALPGRSAFPRPTKAGKPCGGEWKAHSAYGPLPPRCRTGGELSSPRSAGTQVQLGRRLLPRGRTV